MNEILEKLSDIGIVPVVKITDVETAVPLAKALLRGGIPCAEVTFRTEYAAQAIERISTEVPEILLGAGTVTSTEQVDRAVAAGAKFIVCPGLNPSVAQYCILHNIPVIPGACTPSELEQAMSLGLTEVKFFPAENMGGLKTIEAIGAAYPNVHFMPTGGVNINNLSEYLASPKVIACGGSWITPAKALASGDYEAITELARQAMKQVLGCKLIHLGINAESAEEAGRIASAFCDIFALDYLPGGNSVFAGDMVEVMCAKGPGRNGHIAVRVNDLRRAVSYFNAMGHPLDEENYRYNEAGQKVAVYFKEEIGGIAIHLLQK